MFLLHDPSLSLYPSPKSGRDKNEMSRALKSLVSVYFAIFMVGAIAFFFLVNLLDPVDAPWYLFLIFYLTVFVSVFGAIAILWVFLKYLFGSRLAVFKNNQTTVRQSALLSFLFVIGLFFQSVQLLNTFTLVLMALAFGTLELYFLNR